MLNSNTKILFALTVIFYCTINLHATNYYISNLGKDSNTGNNINDPFASIDKLNTIKIQPGDSLLFERGGIYFGEFLLNYSGTSDKPIVIGAYGRGNNPVLQGSYKLNKWENKNDNTYAHKVSNDIKQVYLNNKLLTIARFPNNEYLRIDKPDSVYLIDAELSNMSSIKGATLRVLTCNWQWEIRKVSDYKNDTIILDSLVWRPFKKGFGYYLENKESFLDQVDEWYQNTENNTLYIKSDYNISKAEIKITTKNYGIYIKKNIEYVRIENLEFSMYNFAGVFAEEFVNNIVIENNTFKNIEVFGIFLDTAANSCNLSNNAISNIRGIGISCLELQNSKISNNQIQRIGLIPGYGFDGVNNATGIAVINNEFRTKAYKRVAYNNLIAYNKIDSTGYNGIRVDGTQNRVKNNIVNNAVLTMNDGAGIYCWSLPNDSSYTTGNIFEYNIVQGVHGNTTASAGDHNMTCCFYIDNFSNNISLKNNIATDCKVGFLLNDATYNINCFNNLTYNTNAGIVIDIYKKEASIRRGNYHIIGNTFYLKNREDVGLKIKYQQDHNVVIGIIDSNKYISPTYKYITACFYQDQNTETTVNYQLTSWQSDMGFDAHSEFIGPLPGEKWWELKDKSQLLINKTSKTENITFDNIKYYDEYHNHISRLVLDPYTAKVISKKE